jgi:hypothetical protein
MANTMTLIEKLVDDLQESIKNISDIEEINLSALEDEWRVQDKTYRQWSHDLADAKKLILSKSR